MIKTLTAKKAKSIIEENKQNPQFRIIDVRTREEFSESHIKGALNLDLHDQRFEQTVAKLDKEKTYLLYCKTGGRCGAAAELMEKQGFKKVYSVIGWLFE